VAYFGQYLFYVPINCPKLDLITLKTSLLGLVEINGNASLGGMLVSTEEINMPQSFGSRDTPVCPRCKNAMRLTRRGPHPTLGYVFEIQTFTCGTCHYEILRSADCRGNPAPATEGLAQ
jgi:hypothetical protein